MAPPENDMPGFLRSVFQAANWPRLIVVAGVPAVLAIAFVATTGWIPSSRVTQQKVVTIFDKGGAQPGFRMNHARGLCATGWFEASGNAAGFSQASVFRDHHTPVMARFSLAGSVPTQADAPSDVRALGLRFMPEDGQEWRMGMIILPIFPAPRPDEFLGLTTATAPVNGKPDPARVQAFMSTHPDVVSALGYMKAHMPTSSRFDDASYNSLNAFYLVNGDGARRAVRWSLRPDPDNGVADENATGADYLFGDLVRSFAAHPLHWHLMLTLANAGDPTADPSHPWPDDRQQVDAGVLTLDRAQYAGDGPCTGVVFDPLVLPRGITPSDDPYPAARSAAYMRSYVARAGSAAPSGEKPDAHVQGASQ